MLSLRKNSNEPRRVDYCFICEDSTENKDHFIYGCDPCNCYTAYCFTCDKSILKLLDGLLFKCNQCKTLASTKNCKRVLNGVSNNRLGNIFQNSEDARLINISPSVNLCSIGNNNANLNFNNLNNNNNLGNLNNLVHNNINNNFNLINSENRIIENINVPLNPIPIPINELDFVIYQAGKKKVKPTVRNSKEVEEILKLFPYLQKKETRGKMLFYRSSTHEFMNPSSNNNSNNLNVHMSGTHDLNLNMNLNMNSNNNLLGTNNFRLNQNQNQNSESNLISNKENFKSPLALNLRLNQNDVTARAGLTIRSENIQRPMIEGNSSNVSDIGNSYQARPSNFDYSLLQSKNNSIITNPTTIRKNMPAIRENSNSFSCKRISLPGASNIETSLFAGYNKDKSSNKIRQTTPRPAPRSLLNRSVDINSNTRLNNPEIISNGNELGNNSLSRGGNGNGNGNNIINSNTNSNLNNISVGSNSNSNVVRNNIMPYNSRSSSIFPH